MAAPVWLWLISLRPVSVCDTPSCPWVRLEPNLRGLKPPHVSPPLAWTRHSTVPLPRRKLASVRHGVPFPLCGPASCDQIFPTLFLSQAHHQTLFFQSRLLPHRLLFFVQQANKYIFLAVSAIWKQRKNMVMHWGDLNIPAVTRTESISWETINFQITRCISTKHEVCFRSLLFKITALFFNTITNMLNVCCVQIR